MASTFVVQVILYLLGASCLEVETSAIGFLTSVPEATEQVLTACPDSSISFTCSHNNTDGEQTEWELPGAPPCLVLHRRPEPPACNPFIITMFSDLSGSSLTSTVQTNATESLNGSPVACLAGGLQTSPQVGNITIRVIGSPSVPTTGPIEYSVESATTGRVRFNVSSMGTFGTAVSYNASVVGGSGTVQVSGNTITVMGLNYTQMHSIMVTATSAICPGLGPRSINVPISFSIKKPMITQPVASIICCDQLLPIRVSWTVDPGTQTTTDPNVPLVPPPTATPTITYSSTGGSSGSTSSDSPFDFPNPDVEDMYTFTVSVANVAGPSSAASEISVSAISSDDSTVATSGRLTLNIESDCVEEVTSGNFSVTLEYGVGMCKTIADLQRTETVMETITSPSGVQIPVGTTSAAQLCFNATLLCNNRTVDKTSNLDFERCLVSSLNQTVLGPEFTFSPNVGNGTVSHLTTVPLSCRNSLLVPTGVPVGTCTGGTWMISSSACELPTWLTVVIAILIILITLVVGIVVGIIVATRWGRLVDALAGRESWALAVVVCLSFLFGVGIGILFYMCCYSHKEDSKSSIKTKDADKHGLTQSSSPPPEDRSLYADPNTIEHQTTATGEEYAMVDVKARKKKQTQQAALYQDPNAIEHQTAPSGDTYAVVDKPKRGSSKKSEPDVVPPGSGGLTYAELEVSTSRGKPKPAPQRQTQDPGRVEYSIVAPGEHSNL